MDKRKIPVYQVSSEYAACLERAFAPKGPDAPGAASGGASGTGGAGQRGSMGNTPLEGSQLGRISEDTVHLSVWVNWGENEDALFANLRHSQQKARGKAEAYIPQEEEGESATYGPDLDFDPDNLIPVDDMAISDFEESMPSVEPKDDKFPFGGYLWRMHCHGMGGKDGRSYYPYQIVSGGITIGFRRKKYETVSNMWIEMGSIPLARLGGVDGVWRELLEMFAEEGIVVQKELMSRVDIYADFEDCPVDAFCERFHDKCRVTRAKQVGTYGDELNTAMYFFGRRHTGFSIGSNIKLRCYDKEYELRKDPIKWAVFADKYGHIPEVLTRVEFQLRRASLKEFSFPGVDRIEGVDTYLKVRDMLWRYLTESWFRLTEEKVDSKNNHQSRAKTWSVWEKVQNAVACIENCVQRVKRKINPRMDVIFNMGLSCSIKAAVYECEELIGTAEEFIQYLYGRIKSGGKAAFDTLLQKHYDERLSIVGGVNSSALWG